MSDRHPVSPKSAISDYKSSSSASVLSKLYFSPNESTILMPAIYVRDIDQNTSKLLMHADTVRSAV